MKWLTIIVVLFAASLASATTWPAADCNPSSVLAALNLISADGDVVTIPPCGATSWTSGITYNQVYSFTLQGAGAMVAGAQQALTCVGSDSTTLQDDVNHAGADPGMLVINTIAGKTFHMTGIHFLYGAGNVSLTGNGSVRVNGFSQSVHIDRNHFDNINGLGLSLSTWEYGVADHNCFDNMRKNGILAAHAQWNNTLSGNGSYADDTQWGSSKFIFIEDNTFVSISVPVIYANDCDRGGRMVARYNTLVSGVAFQQHDGSTGSRGCRETEIYNNWILNSGATQSPAVYGRMGLGLIHHNTITGFSPFISAHNDRSDISQSIQPAPPAAFGGCAGSLPHTGTVNTSGTTVTWVSGQTFDTNWPASSPFRIVGAVVASIASVASTTSLTLNQSVATLSGAAYELGSAWDGNTDNYGYPCLDQMGRGKSDLLTGNFPTKVDSVTGTVQWPNQLLEPWYVWANNYTAPGGGGKYWNKGIANDNQVVNENRDYYLEFPNLDEPGLSFDGTAGVGQGLLSARPATCSPLVGYWATDTNTLYQCATMNTWTVYYTPYVYPHPLVTQGQSTAPALGMFARNEHQRPNQ